MKLKDLMNYMYATTKVKIYGLKGVYVYEGRVKYIPDRYRDRNVVRIDSMYYYTVIILEN